ncbi:MAG: GNAT family N-acetyltransferase, partial [Actinomycetia bacterium]|nr:GNAT family N-acetyltransferase [Actinomycetes bacterium]
IINFYKDVSEKSLKQRYLKALHYDELIAHERLINICFTDYDREIALITELKLNNKKSEILGVGRLSKLSGTNDATFSLLVKDKYQHQGIGSKLLETLLTIAKDEKVEYILSSMFKENLEMQNLCKRLGFTLTPSEEHPIIFAELYLK